MSCFNPSQALSVVAAYKVKAEYIWADGQEGAPQKVCMGKTAAGHVGATPWLQPIVRQC